MNIRWLWLDHFPPGLDIGPEQRRSVVQLARTIRKKDNFRSVRRELVKWLLITLCPLTVAFTLWVVYQPKWSSLGLNIASRAAAPIVFNALIWVAITYSMYRTSARYVWRALCEQGFPVCVECGYILRGLGDDESRCPECGEPRRAFPETEP